MQSPFNLYYERGASKVRNAYVIHESVAGWLQIYILVSIRYGMKFLHDLKFFSAQTPDEEFMEIHKYMFEVRHIPFLVLCGVLMGR